MSTAVSEALLEMLYLRPLVERFEKHFGRQVLTLIKPTPNRERYVGFDQGWVKPRQPIAAPSLEGAVRTALAQGHSTIPVLALMVFFQFKHAAEVKRRRRDRNGTYIGQPTHGAPHLRVALDMETRTSGWTHSQHETLRRLAAIQRAHVYYACPLIGDAWDVYAGPPMHALRLVPVSTSPQFPPNSKHFIIFKNRRARAAWCSDAVETDDMTIDQWLERGPPQLASLDDVEETLDLIAKERVPLPPCGLIFVFGPEPRARERVARRS